MIIDADGHTHIPQEVFDNYMEKEFYRQRPRYVQYDDGRGFYLIEGRIIAKPFGWGPGTPGSIAAATRTLRVKDHDLSDIAGRLADLDLEEIDVQVIYPNVLMAINSLEHPGVAGAIARAYNKWISERCAAAGGRLRFAAVVALQDPKAAAEELKHRSHRSRRSRCHGSRDHWHTHLGPPGSLSVLGNGGTPRRRRGRSHRDRHVPHSRPGAIRSFLRCEGRLHAFDSYDGNGFPRWRRYRRSISQTQVRPTRNRLRLVALLDRENGRDARTR